MSGCSMIVYDVRLSGAVVAVASRLQLQQPQRQYQAVGLMLTSGLEMFVCVDRGRVIIWRLPIHDRHTACNKYTTDDAPADDDDTDIDSYLYDDTTECTEYIQQVNSSRDRKVKIYPP